MTPTMFGMRTDKYKYIRYQGIWDRNEFYNLQSDPHEMYNLIGDPSKQDIIKKMLQSLYGWLEETDGMKIPLKSMNRPAWGDYKHSGEY
jgi:arylsulfatase A-like enzyme